jgi:hypothetical protein
VQLANEFFQLRNELWSGLAADWNWCDLEVRHAGFSKRSDAVFDVGGRATQAGELKQLIDEATGPAG